MAPKRPSLRDRATEFAQSDVSADRPTPMLHGDERLRLDVIELPLREIMPNTQQPRTRFDEAALDELAMSIREHGIIQPIIVKAIALTKWQGRVCRYELIAGERRWRASERAGRDTIPTMIRHADSTAALIELALIENLQRADLTPLEEAGAFGHMQQELGYSYDQIGQRVGKSKGYVMNRMRLLRLDDDLRDLVAERPDTLSHVIHLEKLAPGDRAALIRAVREDNLSLAEVRRLVEQHLTISTAPPPLEMETDTTPVAFVRKNRDPQDQTPQRTAPQTDALPSSSFLRKNAEPHLTRSEDVTQAIHQMRTTIRTWNTVVLTEAAHHDVLNALTDLLHDIEHIKRSLEQEHS